jgi:hypothetical protein
MGVPSILRVAGRVVELFARFVEHLGVLEHTTAFIVVECRLRLFHASILPFVTQAPETNSGQWGGEQEQHPTVDPRWTYKSSSYLLHSRLDRRKASTGWPERYAKRTAAVAAKPMLRTARHRDPIGLMARWSRVSR